MTRNPRPELPALVRDPDRRYHGRWGTGGGLVMVLEDDGTMAGILVHVVRHSPSGLAWGYSGSGPADLARSLLIDALEDGARCVTCAGAGRVDLGTFGLFDDDRLCGRTGACPDCDDGWGPLIGRLYQRFKIAVVSTFPVEGDWTLTRGEVLAWVANERPRVKL